MNWHSLSKETVCKLLETDSKLGLSEREAVRRWEKYGENALKEQPHTSLIQKFIAQWKDFMILTLIGAAMVSTGVSFLNGDYDLTDPIIILVIIIVNAVMGVLQESKAEQSLDSLKELTVPKAQVLRNGIPTEVDARLLVPGDIVFLRTGDLVPADGRLIQETGLQTEESSLTGESVPMEKNSEKVLPEEIPLAERINMVYRTSSVTAGLGQMVVTETGMHTEVGKIASYLQETGGIQTPLQEKLATASKVLGLVSIGICSLMFVIGIWRKQGILEMFLTAVSLAVAAIPEGLPAIVTIMLSQGVQRMAKNHAIIRKLPAVETLGSATVICSDKTGTLTKNRMEVEGIYSLNGQESQDHFFYREILKCAILCNDANVTGNPTEKAFLDEADRIHMDQTYIRRKCPRTGEVPFHSDRKYMKTTHYMREGPFGLQGNVEILKGAPDVIFGQCEKVWSGSGFVRMTQRLEKKIKRQNETLAGEGLRLLGFALTTEDKEGRSIPSWVGIIALVDPPRSEVRAAIDTCKKAGIRIVMITGDHPTTAAAIGRNLGICAEAEDCQVMTGKELDQLSEEEFRRHVQEISIFARVTPAHKLRIVQALKACQETVAMSGDGVNDSPALKAADIGCAMGKSGTDVARNAADMILTDDNFATIVFAIEEGRIIYDNIKKSIHFLLSSNIGEILTIFTAIALGYPSPLLPVQLLWMNLVTDSLPAIALGAEKGEADLMTRPPIPREKHIFADGFGLQIFLEGIMIGLLALIAYLYGYQKAGIPGAQSMTFMVLSLSQLFHVFNIRSKGSIFRIGLFSNSKLVGAFLICFILQIGVAVIPGFQTLFSVIPLGMNEWLVVLGLSMAPIFIMELEKAL